MRVPGRAWGNVPACVHPRPPCCRVRTGYHPTTSAIYLMDDKMMRKEEVIGRAVSKVFGKPLVTNVYRSILVEAMIAGVLPETWEWCSQDYNSHDFVHKDGARMEVKQSASW